MAMSLKYVCNFWRTPEMPLIDYKVNVFLIMLAKCVISEEKRITTFTTTDTKPYVLVVLLSTQNDPGLLQKLKSSFKRIINWNKYQSKLRIQEQNKSIFRE